MCNEYLFSPDLFSLREKIRLPWRRTLQDSSVLYHDQDLYSIEVVSKLFRNLHFEYFFGIVKRRLLKVLLKEQLPGEEAVTWAGA